MLIRSCEAFVGGSILHTCHNWEDMQTLDTVLVIVLNHLLLHPGDPGRNTAKSASLITVHVVIGFPISSKPGLQV